MRDYEPFDAVACIHRLQLVETKFLQKISSVLPLVDNGTMSEDEAWEIISQASLERAQAWTQLERDFPRQFSAAPVQAAH